MNEIYIVKFIFQNMPVRVTISRMQYGHKSEDTRPNATRSTQEASGNRWASLPNK
jgi:hypothetical protein